MYVCLFVCVCFVVCLDSFETATVCVIAMTERSERNRQTEKTTTPHIARRTPLLNRGLSSSREDTRHVYPHATKHALHQTDVDDTTLILRAFTLCVAGRNTHHHRTQSRICRGHTSLTFRAFMLFSARHRGTLLTALGWASSRQYLHWYPCRTRPSKGLLVNEHTDGFR